MLLNNVVQIDIYLNFSAFYYSIFESSWFW